MNVNFRVGGAFPAPSVPFDEDLSIIESQFTRHIAAIGAVDGVSGVVVNGHAGELTALTTQERARVITLAREAMPAGKAVISGVDDLSIAGAIQKLHEAADAGADGALILPPFDYLPRRQLTATPQAPYEYFSAIAAGSDLPFVIFEYPKTTGISYTTETLVKLAEIDNVIAIKDTVGDDQAYQEHVELVRPHVPLLTAVDSPELLGYMLLGSDGIVLGASQLAPAYWAAYVNHIIAGEVAEAVDVFKAHLLPIVTHIYSGRFKTMASHNAKIKEALVQTGVFSSSRVRPPELNVSEEDREHVRQGLALGQLAPALV